MNRFDKQLRDFETFHESMANRLCHYVGLSLVTIGTLGALHVVQVTDALSLAVLLLLATLAFDLLTWTRVAIPVFLVGTLYLAVGANISLVANLVLLLVGFAIQIFAHKKFEENEPAFTTNMVHNHIGPRWLVIQVAQLFGFDLGYKNHLTLNTDLVDVVRWLLIKLVPLLGGSAEKKMSEKLKNYQDNQQRLRKIYHVEDEPIRTYDETLREKIILKQEEQGGDFAFTSGSTSKPKQILYTKQRLSLFKKSSVLSSLQAFKRLSISNPSMFIFASLQKDDSFASLVVSTEETMPGLLDGIIEPAKYLSHPLVKSIAKEYGATGARLWVMALNSPSAFYATNPSTLAVFFEEIDANWVLYRKMFQQFELGQGCFSTVHADKNWRRIICRLGRGNYQQRVKVLANAETLPSFDSICPDMKGYICWDGGYVTGFLTKIHAYLPPSKYLHIPMFSMSTETMQTELLLDQGEMHFVPTGEEVLYEFLPVNAQDTDTDKLMLATELEADECYTMIVSDPWGLCRYQTQDIFKCVGKVNGVADIRFQRRQGLAYSFTGEKLTGEQIEEAITELLSKDEELRESGIQFTMVPSEEESQLPSYVLIGAISTKEQLKNIEGETIAADFQSILESINSEYRDKVKSGRLGKLACIILPYDDVAYLLDPKTTAKKDVSNRSWESQFKLTPLTKKLWQTLPTRQLNDGVCHG